MDKEFLKSALFGYSKISVCQYIATMNEEFNEKLMAETEAFRKERTKLQNKIDDLETELAVYKQNAYNVSEVLLDARQHADQLCQQAEEDAAQLRRQAQEEATQLRRQVEDETQQLLLEINKKGQAQTEKIEVYTKAIIKLREDMAILANQTDDALNAFVEQFLSLRQDFEDSEL